MVRAPSRQSGTLPGACLGDNTRGKWKGSEGCQEAETA